jgi:hypothetical protein
MTQAVRAATASPFPATFSFVSRWRAAENASAATWNRWCNAPSIPLTSASCYLSVARFASFATHKEIVLLASQVRW